VRKTCGVVGSSLILRVSELGLGRRSQHSRVCRQWNNRCLPFRGVPFFTNIWLSPRLLSRSVPWLSLGPLYRYSCPWYRLQLGSAVTLVIALGRFLISLPNSNITALCRKSKLFNRIAPSNRQYTTIHLRVSLCLFVAESTS
jgi:hypothetical protein